MAVLSSSSSKEEGRGTITEEGHNDSSSLDIGFILHINFIFIDLDYSSLVVFIKIESA